EGYTRFARRFPIVTDLGEALLLEVDDRGRFPNVSSAPELVTRLLGSEREILAYDPVFPRFAIRDARTRPYELNPALPNKRIVVGESEPAWVMRTRIVSGCYGYTIDWSEPRLKSSYDCKNLGYGD
ncbi:MAG TPA: hypothetical protein VGE01_08265, partial [Fimbriimonas sp.]